MQTAIAWPPNGSTMGALVREMDWAAHPLGASADWPVSLRIAVTAALDSPLPTVVLWGDELTQIYNDAYRPILGPRHPRAMGQATRACWPEVWGFNEPVYRGVLATGTSVYFEDQEFAIKPSGTVEKRYFSVSYAPARDEQGAIRGVIVIAVETTQRVRAELERLAFTKASQIASDQLRQMFQQAPSFMALLQGPNHVIDITNAAYQRLLGGRDVIGKPLRTAIPEAGAEAFFGLLDEVYRSGTPYIGTEMPFALLDPATGMPAPMRYLDFVYQPIRDADGQVCAIFVEGSDVTERKRVSAVLADTDRRKDDFLAMLAHELRNPLAPIANAAALLTRPGAEKVGVQRIGEIIVRQARQMTRLLEDLLDVSRVTKGLITLERARLDIRQVVSHAAEQVRPLMAERHHQLVLHMSEEALYVEGDRARLIQIFANLLNNAAKYTPEGGEIVLTVARAGAQVAVSVRDNGLGISADFLPHVFDIFTQATRTAGRNQGGLGLGLSLVKSLVELQGGVVGAVSEGLGRGSQFAVSLPLLQETPRKNGAQPGLQAQAEAAPLSIMVVDDNADAADMLALVLGMSGHRMSVERSGEAALHRAAAAPPDVMLIDIGLPDMEGYTLARLLRAAGPTAHTVLIACTGYGQPKDRERSRRAGFAHHLVKPVDIAQLLVLLETLRAPHDPHDNAAPPAEAPAAA
jgi:signal transduction histidine kinase/ActR/RegA family two-component response regulator